MRKIVLVMQYELGRTLRRASFLFVAFGIPLIAVVIFGVIALTQKSDGSSATANDAPAFEFAVEGYVDPSGLVQVLPPDIPTDHLIAYADETEARQALASGAITAYYVIPADYVEAGEISYIYPNTASLLDDRQKWVMEWTLLFNLLDGDLERAQAVWSPMYIYARPPDYVSQPTTTENGCAPGAPCAPEAFNKFFPALIVALFYLAFLMSGDLLFKSISGEKENRTIEVLILSVTPRQMLIGKIVGLGTAGLLHMATWIGAVIGILTFSGQALGLPAGFALPPAIPAWSLVFFLLGFAIYASLMAGVGVLVPNIKEAGQATMVAIFPLLVGYIVGLLSALAEVPHAPAPTILSMFPLTAPVLMIMRLTLGNVPWWQPWVAIVLMIGAACIIIRAVAAMFRAQNLLSGQPFSIKRYFLALLGRA